MKSSLGLLFGLLVLALTIGWYFEYVHLALDPVHSPTTCIFPPPPLKEIVNAASITTTSQVEPSSLISSPSPLSSTSSPLSDPSLQSTGATSPATLLLPSSSPFSPSYTTPVGKDIHIDLSEWLDVIRPNILLKWSREALQNPHISAEEKQLAESVQANERTHPHPLSLPDSVLPPHRGVPLPLSQPKIPIIAICLSITTRGLHVERPESLVLFANLLPTIRDTIDDGFEYWVYIGYDQGDPWFDNPNNVLQTKLWFRDNMKKPLLRNRRIRTRLFVERWDNYLHKPGPAMNFITELAFRDGCDYMFRINDDMEFETPWARAMVTQLEQFGAPLYGAVGPHCPHGNTKILTSEMTHRTHHIIFPYHYPISLVDWWLDDWVTTAYGYSRTKLIFQARIKHLLSSHGTRYDVTYASQQKLPVEKKLGRSLVEGYLNYLIQKLKELTGERRSIPQEEDLDKEEHDVAFRPVPSLEVIQERIKHVEDTLNSFLNDRQDFELTQ